jgi:integrase
MNETENLPENTPTWSAAKNGLRQYLRRGDNHKIWYLHCKVRGHSLTESTATTSHSLAVKIKTKKLNDLFKAGVVKKDRSAKSSIGDCVDILKHRIEGASSSEKTIKKKHYLLATLLSTWADVPELQKAGVGDLAECAPKDITFDHILYWKKSFLAVGENDAEGYSSDYFNKTLSLLRDVFEIALERNQLFSNPCDRVKRAKVRNTEKEIPTTEQFETLIAAPSLSPECRDLLNGLRFTGLRIEEANLLKVRHVEVSKKAINLPAEICKGRHHGRTIPIFSEALPLFTRLVKEAGQGDAFVFKIKDARKGIAGASEEVGFGESWTHHTFRHYFATRALECTKNVVTVANWLGHLDKGQLLLKTYAHVCAQFSQEAADQMVFSKAAAQPQAPTTAEVAPPAAQQLTTRQLVQVGEYLADQAARAKQAPKEAMPANVIQLVG